MSTSARELTVGMGAGGLATSDMVLNIGPQHPATHGVLRLQVVLDGERVISADPVVGYMHRGAEKLFEVRDYRQITVLANRHDWLSAFGNELGVVLGVEAMLGMEVPERATWARTLLAELNRVLNHLMFLGSYPLELGAMTPIFYSFREREEIQAVMEEISGGRMHYMFNRVGGLRDDIPAGWLDRAAAAVSLVRSRMPEIESFIVGNPILNARTKGVVRSGQVAARAKRWREPTVLLHRCHSSESSRTGMLATPSPGVNGASTTSPSPAQCGRGHSTRPGAHRSGRGHPTRPGTGFRSPTASNAPGRERKSPAA